MVLCEDADVKSPSRIAELIYDSQVTHVHFVPSMLQVFAESVVAREDSNVLLHSLKRIFTSGEALAVQRLPAGMPIQMCR